MTTKNQSLECSIETLRAEIEQTIEFPVLLERSRFARRGYKFRLMPEGAHNVTRALVAAETMEGLAESARGFLAGYRLRA